MTSQGNDMIATMVSPDQQLKAAIERHRAGEHAEAEKAYRDYLREHAQDPTALHFLGLMRHQQGHTLEGIELMEAAVRADPEYVDAWSNLGIAFYRQRDFERSEGCCRRALALAPDFVNAWCSLGFTLRDKNALDASLAAWERALELQPGLRSVAIPYGRLLYKMNRIDAARAFYERWFQANPADPVAAHMRAAMDGDALQPERASDEYVRVTFDDFADSFDTQLRNLGYRAPQVLHELARNAFKDGSTDPALRILDLGCGTGLCGELFQPMSRRLVGVDLSSKMLAKCAARGCYQQLNQGELAAFMRDCGEQFDLVLAADVLCYFGSLTEAFECVRCVLAPDGHFLFSLEDVCNSGTEPAAGYLLKPHGRYEHARAYVEAALQHAGLHPARVLGESLRLERGEPVAGLVVDATVRCSAMRSAGGA
jgi:predicted TPR repeat methyltransferase